MRLGIFGGSFDPPHLGHLAVAQDAIEALALEELLLVPARVSPFKVGEPVSAGALRAEMLEAAVAGHPRMRVWRGELERPAPSYTRDTLTQIRDEHPGAELLLLMGDDQWASFPGWRSPREILGLVRVCVLTRSPEAAGRDAPEWPHERVPTRRMEISSTEIRERVAAGLSVRFLVPEAVRSLIEVRGLYGTSDTTSDTAPDPAASATGLRTPGP
ncbi:MAG: nicotinate (nicotinamide) nucleotide adenylyltransferase [Longimicrobiales bacterium]|nr:nicotinate (nicotinamide) nucleotide adenylyltransferase [Longimicrobiales bacterium]